MLFAGSVAVVGLMLGTPTADAVASEPPPDPVTTVAENPFLPEDAEVDLTDCISAVPRPECGSEERGGWRQYIAFGAMAGGIALIGARIVIQMRRRESRAEGGATSR
jgi:hypothetical protein